MEKKDLHIKFAKALHKLALKQGKSAEFFEQLKELEDLLTDKALYQMLALVVGMEVSRVDEVVRGAFGKTLDEGILNLLILVVANREMRLFSAIRKSYQKFYFEEAGIADFVIASGRELGEKEKTELEKKLAGKEDKIHVSYQVNADLIGGIQIYKNGLLTDYSLRGQLDQLKRELIGEHN